MAGQRGKAALHWTSVEFGSATKTPNFGNKYLQLQHQKHHSANYTWLTFGTPASLLLLLLLISASGACEAVRRNVRIRPGFEISGAEVGNIDSPGSNLAVTSVAEAGVTYRPPVVDMNYLGGPVSSSVMAKTIAFHEGLWQFPSSQLSVLEDYVVDMTLLLRKISFENHAGDVETNPSLLCMVRYLECSREGVDEDCRQLTHAQETHPPVSQPEQLVEHCDRILPGAST
jgi:hypothetical protein